MGRYTKNPDRFAVPVPEEWAPGTVIKVHLDYFAINGAKLGGGTAGGIDSPLMCPVPPSITERIAYARGTVSESARPTKFRHLIWSDNGGIYAVPAKEAKAS